MSLKNPVTPPEIDAGTVRLVAQRLNHYANPGPTILMLLIINTLITLVGNFFFSLPVQILCDPYSLQTAESEYDKQIALTH